MKKIKGAVEDLLTHAYSDGCEGLKYQSKQTTKAQLQLIAEIRKLRKAAKRVVSVLEDANWYTDTSTEIAALETAVRALQETL